MTDRSIPRTREHVEEQEEVSPRDVETASAHGVGAGASGIEGHEHRRKSSGHGLDGLKKRIGALRHKDHAPWTGTDQ